MSQEETPVEHHPTLFRDAPTVTLEYRAAVRLRMEERFVFQGVRVDQLLAIYAVDQAQVTVEGLTVNKDRRVRANAGRHRYVVPREVVLQHAPDAIGRAEALLAVVAGALALASQP
ncbi:hypothetical protein D3C74_247940 [compost metagenome]